MKMKLNFFGETENVSTENATQEGNTQNQTNEDGKHTEGNETQNKDTNKLDTENKEGLISKSDLETLLKSERDKSVAEAVAEALKLTKMSEKEQQDYKEKQKLKDLEEREKTIATRELKAEAITLLSTENIDVSLVNVILGKDLESTKSNIKIFKDTFDKAVQAQVEKRLAGKSPSVGNSNIETSPASDFMGVIKSNQANRK